MFNSRALRNTGIGRNERISDAPMFRDVTSQPELPIQEPEMPASTTLRLVMLRSESRVGDEALYVKIADAMQRHGVTWSMTDFDTLRREGYVVRNHLGARHMMTPMGRSYVERIARGLSRDYGVHHMVLRKATSRSNMGHFGYCSCGQWSQTVSRAEHDYTRLQDRAAEHLETMV